MFHRAPIFRLFAIRNLLPSFLLAVGAASFACVGAQTVGVGFSLDFQARGPVHEAFAQPVVFDAGAAIVITNEPPPLIEETPPDERPVGADVLWIPGYWSFDDDAKSYLWVTGCWRLAPPGQNWVSGYWSQDRTNWRWTGGFWRPSSAGVEVEYLPTPPESIEEGAPTAPPAVGATWVNGLWIWRENAYAWRPGFWVSARPDWTYVPSHYVSTPSGAIYIDGSWDYDVDRRGVLFAPVAFRTYPAAGFRFEPSVAISAGVFSSDCFVRPNSRSYYFGDYYAESEWRRGIYPAYAFHGSRYGYDPLFVSLSFGVEVGGRRDDRWGDSRRERFENLRDHAEARPARTYAAERDVARGGDRNRGERSRIAVPLQELPTAHASMKLRKSDESERTRYAAEAKAERAEALERRHIETAAVDPIPAKAGEKPADRPVGNADGRRTDNPEKPRRVALATAGQKSNVKLASNANTVAPAKPEAPTVDPKRKPAAASDPKRARLPEPSVKPVPKKPVAPADPKAEKPKDADKPKDPAKPKESDKPVVPVKPREADKPKEPTKPRESDRPVVPVKPREADKPKDPAKPKESDRPKTPERPTSAPVKPTSRPVKPPGREDS